MAVGGVYRLEAAQNISKNRRAYLGVLLLLTKEVSEICDCVLAVSDKLLFGLLTIVFFSINIRQDRRNLTICDTHQHFFKHLIPLWHDLPPSSLAITSALSSTVVTAMELLEFPKEIPMVCRSPGVEPLVVSRSADILPILDITAEEEKGCSVRNPSQGRS